MRVLRRTLVKDAELAGKQLREGDSVLLLYCSANRDEAVFEDPYAFRVDRTPNEHLAFGIGPHFCLGANLARMEIAVVVERVLARLPGLGLAPGERPRRGRATRSSRRSTRCRSCSSRARDGIGSRATPTTLALRHVAFEDLGLLAPWLERRGHAIRYAEAPTDDVARIDPLAPDLLVVLGGPIGAYEEAQYPFLVPELRLLERRLAAGRPTLGLCLGAQLMARALGARVYPGKAKEIGWSALSLAPAGRESCLRHLEATPVLHWHGDTFDLPERAVRLASTALTENQAFAWGDAALALQFHAEAAGPGSSAGSSATRSRSRPRRACGRGAARRHAALLAGDRARRPRLFEEWLAGGPLASRAASRRQRRRRRRANLSARRRQRDQSTPGQPTGSLSDEPRTSPTSRAPVRTTSTSSSSKVMPATTPVPSNESSSCAAASPGSSRRRDRGSRESPSRCRRRPARTPPPMSSTRSSSSTVPTSASTAVVSNESSSAPPAARLTASMRAPVGDAGDGAVERQRVRAR